MIPKAWTGNESRFLILMLCSFAVAALLTSCAKTAGDGREDVDNGLRTGEPAIVVLKELPTVLKADVDLRDNQANYSYNFSNRLGESRDLRLRQPGVQAKPFQLELPARESRIVEFKEAVPVTAVSSRTRMVSLRPFLYSIQDGEQDRVIVTDYRFDFTVRLPDGAKFLKSIIPFEVQPDNRLRWTEEGHTAIPPFDIWFTLAEERVSIERELVEDDDLVTFKVGLRNESSITLTGIRLRSQFPKGTYLIEESESDGEFKLLDDNTYRWFGHIDDLAQGQVRTFELVLRKLYPGRPILDLEILAYNADGDLLEISSASD